ncbi:cobalamin-binding protein [cf. Phormidesmis sp. LEGE 11477]|uniref:cobalamin-binding protein n=1 Tax=cf. Phormidesmis sp. LEGE 11477 TaxID=1828680 RepID=UPI001880AB34|nr:cobalamin-binding protein [cf. Phormidesmis sp. LEGE 11477]MBE9063385.1 cobalamin-binding protein [cf. Phormidesmis sp. LEGE 11477]
MSRTDLRIVSLIPSATEIVAALGYADCLVGRSHECDYPPAVRSLPICTEPKFDPVGTSGEIHRRVTDLLTSALSVYRVKTEILSDLRPTHIITQAQCEVCAVSLGDVEQAVIELVNSNSTESNSTQSNSIKKESPIQIVSLQPERLADVWTDMARVATALDSSLESKVAADQTIAQLKQRLALIETESTSKETLPTVACIEWTDPLMAAGNWVPELVSLAGGSDCFGQAGQHSDWMSWEDLVAADPDIIVVLPCGYDLSQSRQATVEMAKHPCWQQLKAVRAENVYLTDGNQYFNRPGPRLVESGEILTEIIQRKPVDAKRQPTGWQNWYGRDC